VPVPEAPIPLVEKRAEAVRGNILFAVGIFLLLALAYKIARELEILYVSALFAVVLMPAVRKITTLNIRGYRPSNAVAIIALIVIAAILATIFFTLGLPPVLRDLRNFLNDLPRRIPQVVANIKRLPIADKFDVDSLAARAENFMGAVGAYIVNAIPGWLSHIFDILTAAFLCIYFILEGEHAYDFFLSLFPPNGSRRLDITLRKAELKMSKWLFGQGLLMLSMGVTFTIAFGILHVRYFLLLGVLMGLLNIIPIAGGAITISLALIVASIDSWTKAFAVLIVYIIYINLENAVLTPRIMRSSVNLMGLTVLVALLIGTAVAGIVGALVAVPTAALVSVLLDEYAVQR
jgi:predicted PurR-regulated permease PerM